MDAFVSLLERVMGADKATLRTKEDVLCCMPRPEACEGDLAELPCSVTQKKEPPQGERAAGQGTGSR